MISTTSRVFYSLEYRTMEKVQKPSNSVCYTPSSEPFRIYLCVYSRTWRETYRKAFERKSVFYHALSVICHAENVWICLKTRAQLCLYSILSHCSLDFHFGPEDTNPLAKGEKVLAIVGNTWSSSDCKRQVSSIHLSICRAYITEALLRQKISLNEDSRSFWFTFPILCYRKWVGSGPQLHSFFLDLISIRCRIYDAHTGQCLTSSSSCVWSTLRPLSLLCELDGYFFYVLHK
jgi:hypothetical protein